MSVEQLLHCVESNLQFMVDCQKGVYSVKYVCKISTFYCLESGFRTFFYIFLLFMLNPYLGLFWNLFPSFPSPPKSIPIYVFPFHCPCLRRMPNPTFNQFIWPKHFCFIFTNSWLWPIHTCTDTDYTLTIC